MKKLRVTVDGKAYDVIVEVLDDGRGQSHSPIPLPSTPAPAPAPEPVAAPEAHHSSEDGALPSPIAGKVVSVDVQIGQQVEVGTTLITIESMKMNTFVTAPSAGKVTSIEVKSGDSVQEGQPLLVLA